MEAAADRYAGHTDLGQLGDGRRAGQHQNAQRPVDRGDDRAQALGVVHRRREQHVGSRLLVRLQAGDGVGQVGVAAEVVLGPGGEHEAGRAVGHLGGGPHPLGRPIDRVQPGVGPAEVLHRPAGQSGVDGRAHGGGHTVGVVGEGIFQVGRHRHVDRGGQRGAVGDRLLAA